VPAACIRVFSIDDDEPTSNLYRVAVGFEPDMEFAGSCTTTAGMIQAVEAARPSILLLDLMMPGCDTLAALRELRARFPTLIVLVVSGLDEASIVTEAFLRGASGFFLKTVDLASVISAIRRAVAGERVNTGPKPTVSLEGANPSAPKLAT
jgi:DNA-binding NarL/FixJ family response regulator